jgi:hypothetical protein
MHRQTWLLGAGRTMQRRQAWVDGRDWRLSKRGRDLHRLHNARISRQVHAVHGPAAGLDAIYPGDSKLRPGHSRVASLYTGFDEQGPSWRGQ